MLGEQFLSRRHTQVGGALVGCSDMSGVDARLRRDEIQIPVREFRLKLSVRFHLFRQMDGNWANGCEFHQSSAPRFLSEKSDILRILRVSRQRLSPGGERRAVFREASPPIPWARRVGESGRDGGSNQGFFSLGWDILLGKKEPSHSIGRGLAT